MNLQVLPLRVLVSRKVIRDRMDYTDYLAGKTKSEMDMLDRLEGKFEVQASELIIERFLGGGKLSREEWETHKRRMPNFLLNFLNGKSEFNIIETSESRKGRRMWIISDVDGLQKGYQLRSRGAPTKGCAHNCTNAPIHWIHSDGFVEDGKLVNAQKAFGMGPGRKVILMVDLLDTFITDEQGNVVRKFIWRMPILDIKITKVMFAQRVV